jgi:hypothetical protein
MKIIYRDFLEFLKLLNVHDVEYLLVGGYAVAYHGYPRMTMDMDIWIKISDRNAQNIVKAIREFGFNTDNLNEELFNKMDTIVRMGKKPQLIEIMTTISGVEFDSCYTRRIKKNIDGTDVSIISCEDLKLNKIAAGRSKDIADLDYI